MGQKVHPEAMRVGYIHDWKSTWFNEREFSDYLLEDIRIRDHITNKLAHAGLSNITIKNSRFENCAVMDLFFTRGTWYNQPEYGGWTLINNYFDMPRRVNGQGHGHAALAPDVSPRSDASSRQHPPASRTQRSRTFQP